MKSVRKLAVAVLAAAAVAVFPATASADPGGLVADKYPATLHGIQSTELVLSGGMGYVVCGYNSPKMTFEATLEEPYSSATTSTVTKANCGFSALVPHGCQFELHPESGTLDIGPAECEPFGIFSQSCAGSYAIPAQSGISAEYVNFGSGSSAYFKIVIDDDDVKYTAKSNNLCQKAGTYEDLDVSGTFEVTAADSEENSIGVTAYSGGLFFAGGTEETGEPRMAASRYPAQVVGERFDFGEPWVGQITLFERGAVRASCESAEIDGGELSGPLSGEITLDAKYSECKIQEVGLSATVSMNSCHYTYSNLELISEGKYAEYGATAAIVCDEEGDGISISALGCTIEVPEQTLGGEPTSFTNLPEIEEATVAGIMTGAGVQYTTVGGTCKLIFGSEWGSEVSGEDASLKSDMLLHAVYVD